MHRCACFSVSTRYQKDSGQKHDGETQQLEERLMKTNQRAILYKRHAKMRLKELV